MASDNSRTFLGEYCAARDGRTITFATPAYRRRHQFYMGAFCLGMLGIFSGAMTYAYVLDPGEFARVSWFVIITFCLQIWFFLSMAIGYYQSAGVNTIVFDLERRAYERVLCAEPPFSLDNTSKVYGLGHSFKRRRITGSIEEITGIRIMTRRMGGGKAAKYQGYTLNLMWKNAKQPPMIVGFTRSEGKAWDLAAQISEALDVLVFRLDRTNSWAALALETRLQTIPDARNSA